MNQFRLSSCSFLYLCYQNLHCFNHSINHGCKCSLIFCSLLRQDYVNTSHVVLSWYVCCIGKSKEFELSLFTIELHFNIILILRRVTITYLIQTSLFGRSSFSTLLTTFVLAGQEVLIFFVDWDKLFSIHKCF